MSTPAQVWESFATKAKPRRAVNEAGAATWINWTQYRDHGPNESVLGPVGGKRVLELGSGAGANLAHLATLGARCTGVDLAPSRTKTAANQWGSMPNIEFVTADAVDYLADAPGTYDVVFSIFGAVWFIEPEQLLPLIHQALAPDGVLAFSHLPPSGEPQPPDRLITKQELPLEMWAQLLKDAGFVDLSSEIIPAPDTGKPGTMLARARRS